MKTYIDKVKSVENIYIFNTALVPALVQELYYLVSVCSYSLFFASRFFLCAEFVLIVF